MCSNGLAQGREEQFKAPTSSVFRASLAAKGWTKPQIDKRFELEAIAQFRQELLPQYSQGKKQPQSTQKNLRSILAYVGQFDLWANYKIPQKLELSRIKL